MGNSKALKEAAAEAEAECQKHFVNNPWECVWEGKIERE